MSEDNFIPIKLEFREGTLLRKLQDENDELQRKLDIAVEALKCYTVFWGIDGAVAREALKKIEAQHK